MYKRTGSKQGPVTILQIGLYNSAGRILSRIGRTKSIEHYGTTVDYVMLANPSGHYNVSLVLLTSEGLVVK